MVTGKELFGHKNVLLADGKTYTLEFSFESLMELEEKKNGDVQAVFDMFEKDNNSKNMILCLWACLLTHHEEFSTLTDAEIMKKFKKLINAENYLVVKLACIGSFASYWNEVQNSKQIPDEYKQVLEEMNQKGNKKK